MSKIYSISIDGIDKAGKGSVEDYVKILGNYKYVVLDRGLVSNMAYSKKFNRQYDYDIEQFRNWLFVWLVCDEEDWNIRCKLTNEPKISYADDINMFKDEFYTLATKGFHVLQLNTSQLTPYVCAKLIIQKIEELNAD